MKGCAQSAINVIPIEPAVVARGGGFTKAGTGQRNTAFGKERAVNTVIYGNRFIICVEAKNSTSLLQRRNNGFNTVIIRLCKVNQQVKVDEFNDLLLSRRQGGNEGEKLLAIKLIRILHKEIEQGLSAILGIRKRFVNQGVFQIAIRQKILNFLVGTVSVFGVVDNLFRDVLVFVLIHHHHIVDIHEGLKHSVCRIAVKKRIVVSINIYILKLCKPACILSVVRASEGKHIVNDGCYVTVRLKEHFNHILARGFLPKKEIAEKLSRIILLKEVQNFKCALRVLHPRRKIRSCLCKACTNRIQHMVDFLHFLLKKSLIF